MASRRIVPCIVLLSLVIAVSAFAMIDRPAPSPPALSAPQLKAPNSPMVLSSGADTVWIQVHSSAGLCPGDPSWGHGGEASGGPGPLETWCFEGGDSCGTNPPWDTKCFTHEDVRSKPSHMDINYWHIDTYRTDQRPYCGSYALWCGSDSLWTDGYPVECGTWASGKTPGYADQWNCYVQLTLPGSFDVANGCTLYFDPRYDTECKYDYFYVDFWDGTQWVTVATFNASSNNPGAECGSVSGGNPDYWGNTDSGQPNSADWQERANPGYPAFSSVIPPGTLIITSGPEFRWRFTSDGAWSDADGRGDTDGAAFIDNVWVFGDSLRYFEDFETGILDTNYWSLPDPDPVRDSWHFAHDPDPPYEGGDGGDRTSCTADSSYVWRGRPEGGYTQPGKNQWYYRLMTPSVPIQNTGCVIQYDEFECTLDYTCDYGDTKVRFYDSNQAKWCPWTDMDGFWIPSNCYFWSFNSNEDVSAFYSATAESMQFGWELMDAATSPSEFCYGKHKQTEYQVDNVSIGFYDAHATEFSARSIDIFQDTFFDNLCGFNSFFKAYNSDTVSHYSGPPYDDVPIPREKQLYVNINDPDLLQEVRLYGSIDEGASWQFVQMQLDIPNDPGNPARGGDYYGTLCPDDFGLGTWDAGTEIWYYVRVEDQLASYEYWPPEADPSHAYHTGEANDYFTFSILPVYPPTYTGPRILLVDGYGRKNYDWSPCVSELDDMKPLEDIYEAILTDAGYCYDKYDISGAGSNVHVHPIWYSDYDAVVWFTGPYFSNYLFDGKAQDSLKAYLAGGGKVVLCGDRIAYNMAEVGEDSLGGEFLQGIMGCDYLADDYSAFTKPYFYTQAAETVSVFGTPTVIGPTLLDSLLIYRECPYLKDMSYVRTIATPWPGYTAQPLLRLLNPEPAYDPADMAIYTESNGVGQCVFVNVDLCAVANHERTYCDGDAQTPAPDFDAGTYDGSVELMRVILEDLFGLPSTGGGGPAGVEEPKVHGTWALGQNSPNPCVTSTEIRYEVARPCRVSLKIYNAQGQIVRVLEDGWTDAGIHTVHWDGCNASGDRVSSGVYFYKIGGGGYNATRKLIVAR